MSESSESNGRGKIAPPLQPTRGTSVRTARVGLIAGILVLAGGATAQAAVAPQGPETAPKETAPTETAPQQSPEAEVKRLEGEVQELQESLESAQKCEADKSAEKRTCPSVEDAQLALKVRRERLTRARKKESSGKQTNR